VEFGGTRCVNTFKKIDERRSNCGTRVKHAIGTHSNECCCLHDFVVSY